MKRIWAAIGIVLAIGGIVRAQGTSQDRIYSRQKAFRIPFQIPDPTEQKQLQEVQLYVARNGGKWEKYTSAPPDVAPEKRSFTFRTDQDGEFWFAVRTMDKKGALNPAEDTEMQVGLRVIVDSEVPKIELHSVPRGGREVGIEWEVQDRNIDLESLKMEYRIDGQDAWRAVPGVVQKFFGQVFWTPDASGRVTVRCQVQDRAHNLGIQSVELEPASGNDATEFGQTPESLGTLGPQNSTAPISSGLKPFNTQPDIPVNRPSLNGKNSGTSPKRNPANNRAVTIDQKFDSATSDPATPAGDESSSGPGTSTPRRSNASKYDFDAIDGSTPKRMTPAGGTNKPTNRQIVNDSEVSLDYQIDDEGPSGVSVIELWVTTDVGRTWRRVGEDPDRQSPFVVNFQAEGLYGLTMVAKSGVGLGDRPPVAGDQPQMWIEVDKTAPHIQLNTPEVGKGPQAGSIIISWQAEDANLGDRCVSLFYAGGTSNDWKPIATGLENTGRYIWKLNGQMPNPFRVAIEIADLAGNREMSESPEVTIDMSKPKPRISGVNSGKTYR
jgi:hypothetical protein